MRDLEYIKDPSRIEKKSFEIIKEHVNLERFTPEERKIALRVIHTTADFEYVDNIRFSSDAIERGLGALQKGTNIITDTNMAKAGINKKALKHLNCSVHCYVGTPEVWEKAKTEKITRSMAAMMKATENEKNKIFVIGNAPTALFTLISLVEEKKVFPELIIGVPVGFVGAAESKELLEKTKVPYILTKGRKGGSNVAASIVNALMYMIYR